MHFICVSMYNNLLIEVNKILNNLFFYRLSSVKSKWLNRIDLFHLHKCLFGSVNRIALDMAFNM